MAKIAHSREGKRVRIRTLFFLVLLAAGVLFFAACSESEGQYAIKRAEARRIDEETQQQIEERQAAELRRQEDWKSTRAAWTVAKSVFFLVVFVSIAAAIAIGGFAALFRIHRLGAALQRKADLNARMIMLDAGTGTYPALILGDAVHMLESGAVFKIGAIRDEVPQLVAHSAFTRNLALAARTAVQVADATKDSQAADAFGTAAGALPNPYRERGELWAERETVAKSRVLPDALKEAIDRRLERQESSTPQPSSRQESIVCDDSSL